MEKPKIKPLDRNSDISVLVAMAQKVLREYGMNKEADELFKRVHTNVINFNEYELAKTQQILRHYNMNEAAEELSRKFKTETTELDRALSIIFEYVEEDCTIYYSEFDEDPDDLRESKQFFSR